MPFPGSLEEYRHKRRFGTTPEPTGDAQPKVPSAPRSFVVQKHAASRLHYDVRLELDGVLVSWAVPKGPSLDPSDKRLAVHVEDHPLDYGDFEGTIPKGEYGGGTVMVWDRGTWEPVAEDDPAKHLAEGHLKLRLFGEKLQGAWMLVRAFYHETDQPDKNWLLFKERDEFARPKSEFDVTKLDKSAKTRRSMEEIANATRPHVWHTDRGAESEERERGAPATAPQPARAAAPSATAAPSARRPALSKLRGAKKVGLPKSLDVELALLVKEVPRGEEWLHEIKFDGYRAYCRLDGGKASFTSRNQNDWTGHFRGIAEAAAKLPVKQAILDGEVVVLLPDGRTSFQGLQNAIASEPPRDLKYMVFDLLYLDGYDLRGVKLEERKKLLQALLGNEAGPLRYVDDVRGSGEEFYRQACGFALEGVVSKRRDRPYVAGRGREWQKVKCLQRQEFVIVGFTDPGGGRTGIGALLLGVRDGEGLRYAGRVGTGFNERTLRDLRLRLEPLEQKDAAVLGVPDGGRAKGVHWVQPKLVAEVAFSEWTADGQLRHPSFQGLREDKPAEDVVVERPVDPASAPSGDGQKPGEARVGGVKITHPGRVMYPDIGLTKLELVEYYERIEKWVLPYVIDRPLTLVRCPQGFTGQCFYHKHVTETFGSRIGRVAIAESGGVADYITIHNIGGLLSLVQMGTLEFHPWGSRDDDPEKPDQIIFDLDPDPDLPYSRLVDAARLLRERLHDFGLTSFVKTTGGKGLHVVVPLRRTTSWDDMKAFSKAVVDGVVAVAPNLYTANMSKAKRAGKIYIDYLRNSRGSTAIAAYSARARPGAPVAVPVFWEELDDVRPDAFHVRDIETRLTHLKRDPWADFGKTRQQITGKMRREAGM